ncbi:CapA family protein [Candidatus Formimonas warabiya]|uniref:Capsule synthesis protein CapA domain-containing protein n=1 Tax=Formimonas warabiya TaxID=1761012 RepID=A0A3G1KMV4_FORW1|nr:CapA family protein [Candidatus Formimonas warabiya]ATW23779.1 hypothetical protein DCMF_02295 [Candidatus Formimonas warabiya]
MKKNGKILVSLIMMVFLLSLTGCISLVGDMSPIKEEEETPVAVPEVIVPEISLIGVGDVMLARKLDRLISRHGMEYPFQQTRELLASADIAFANLESPLSDQGKKIEGKGIWFRGNPKNVQALSQAGFDVISVANNHALDYDSPAFLQTLEILQGAGIKPVGGGKDIEQARSPVIMDVQGIKVAFLAYSEMADMIWSAKHPRKLKATEDMPGIAPLVVEQIEEDVEQIKNEVDYVMVSLHWGEEYQYLPQSYQQEIAHQLIDAGVDVVLGHHPHCLQGVELYHQGLIAYSLGNFVFDQNQMEKTKQGLLLHLKLDPTKILSAELLPIYINDGQPVVAQGEMAHEILQRTCDVSEKLGTKLDLKEGKAVIMSQVEAQEGGDTL